MKQSGLIFFCALLLLAPIAQSTAQVMCGIDVLEADHFSPLRGKRIGLITNPTGKTRSGKSTAQILAGTPGLNLQIIFSPEHGITGSSEDDVIKDSAITLAGRSITVRSLYGSVIGSMRPKQEDLKNLDVLVFDIQDIGARFYTYLATMGMALEETKAAGIEMMVLDRPNPLTGSIVEGPILGDMSLRQVSPTTYYPVSVRHGLTSGEMATMYNSEVHNPKLTVVKLQGWSRGLWYDQTGLTWTPPSPNIPDLAAATMYPGIGMFESADPSVSVGRGTPIPFQWIGAPWMKSSLVVDKLKTMDLEGVEFTTQDFKPTKSVFSGVDCHGVRITVTDRAKLRPTAVFVALAVALREINPGDVLWKWPEVKKMVGTDRFRELYERNASVEQLTGLFTSGAKDFERRRTPYLLY